MVRTACVDLPAFPLQLLLQRQPDWRDQPVAVVAGDRPQSEILWVGQRARACGVLPGMRYAAALSLVPGLRAAVVAPAEIAQRVATLGTCLRELTPYVEPATDEPGVFWLDARGLERKFGSLQIWAEQVAARVERSGFLAGVVVGFSRFGTYALARAHRGVHLLHNPAEERDAVCAVSLRHLTLPAKARETLTRLGIERVGQLIDLPLDGVDRRFDDDVRRLHRWASGLLEVPLQPEQPDVPAMRRHTFDVPVTHVAQLVAVIESLLGPLLDEIGRKAHVLAELQIGLRFERLGDHLESLRPAGPTLDPRQLLELVRLRLEMVRRLPDSVIEVTLVAGETAALPRQHELLVAERRRDLDAANRALARVRAQLGDGAVVRARLRNGHLPEARFAWEPLAALGAARPRGRDQPRLVRRIRQIPLPLPPRERHEPDGWMLRGLEQGPVVRVLGPYVLSGGWWRRPAHRDYHFAETRQGELLWVYYDRMRRRWFLQGRVE